MNKPDQSTNMSNVEMMKVELYRWKPRFSSLSIWLYAKPYGFHISALYYALLVAAFLALGVFTSIALNDPLWFSRLGSFIIVFGILFGIHGVEGKIESDIYYCNEILKAMEQDEYDAQQLSRDNLFSNAPKQIVDDVIFPVSQGFSKSRGDQWKQRIIRNTFRIDATFAIIGTLVWGFGDLIMPLQKIK